MSQPTRVIERGDPQWPSTFDLIGQDLPDRLYVRGDGDLAKLVDLGIGIVGARAATPYGETCTGMLVSEIAGAARDSACIVSGGAFGIDGKAHRTALVEQLPTVVVLACGVDKAYPTGHAQLFEQVLANGGLIVSEYPDGTVPGRDRFLARNRIIAALSRAVVVVEAASRSGSLNTARRANEYGRPVLGMPGPRTSAMSVGVHQLLLDDLAELAVDGYSVVARAKQQRVDDLAAAMANAGDTADIDYRVWFVKAVRDAKATRDGGDSDVEVEALWHAVEMANQLLVRNGLIGKNEVEL